mgnify:CR=1 FL=1
MAKPEINTPRGSITITKYGKAELKFNTNFRGKWQKRYSQSQKFVDSEVLRFSEPFTPMLSGMMIKSGDLGTEVGSGTVKWIAPYSRRQYYATRKPGSQTGPLRGPFWFQRMKEIHGQTIIAGARKKMKDEK